MEADINNSPERIQSEKFDNAAPGIPKIEMSEAAATGNIDAPAKIDVRNTNFWYAAKQALYDVSIPLRERQVTALIGPSGCGKSTFLRTLNRMNDLIPGTRTEGEALLDGENVYDKSLDVVLLRQRVGMVFQRPNPFPKSSLKMLRMVCACKAHRIVISTTRWKKACKIQLFGMRSKIA